MALIIDGHNLIGELSTIQLGDHDDELQLLRRLRAYHGHTGKTLIVFFDSGDMPGNSEPTSSSGVQVYFARRPQTADDAIVAFLRKSREPGQYAVVTNDRELTNRARQAGASVIKSSQFAEQLQPRAKTHGASEPEEKIIAPRDVAFADLFEGFLTAEKDSARFKNDAAQDFAWWQEQLYNDDAEQAERAVHWMRRFGERERAVPVLLDALTHGQARVRAAAALALGTVKAAPARDALIACLQKDTSSLAREAAAQALGEIGGAQAIAALQHAAEHDDKRKVRKTAELMLEKQRTTTNKKLKNG